MTKRLSLLLAMATLLLAYFPSSMANGEADETDAVTAFVHTDSYFDRLNIRLTPSDKGEHFWLRSMEEFGLEVTCRQGYMGKTSASVRMRRGPDRESKALKTLDAGAKVEILLRGEGWTMVNYRGQIGYIMSRYLIFPK